MELTVREVARYLGVSEKEIYRWVSEGSIPLHEVGGHYRFNRTELLEWANARNLRVSTAIYRKEENARPLPSIAEALESGGVLYRLAGQDCWRDDRCNPDEANELMADPDLVASATLGQIKTMLTGCVGGESIWVGDWGEQLSTGTVAAILRRLRELRETVA